MIYKQIFHQIQPKVYRIAILLSNFQEPKGSNLVEPTARRSQSLLIKKYT